ncbi:hypothetical protein [Streptomyces sp. NPDC086838]|uniref:hypothetical protein n=1 Tax=Streptomyces sp. NPDC086838 TaxID=3365762 RepID=UPI00382B3283
MAIHSKRVAFYGGYGDEVDRLTRGELKEASVQPTDIGLLTPPDGHLPRRRAVSRGSKIYVQAEPFTEEHPCQIVQNEDGEQRRFFS